MNKKDLSTWKHTHSFGQEERRAGEQRTLIVIGITATMMIVEIVAGIMFGSMALLADGIHMASHAVALSINAFAYIYARKHAHDSRFSFGTGKVNALGGFSGAIILALFALFMVWESIERLIFPTEIVFNSAILVAVVGLVVNGASVFILGETHHHDGEGSHSEAHSHDESHHHSNHGHGHHHGHAHNHDHNLRSAYLHVLADALTSLTAIIALLAGKFFGWIWMDPFMGIVGAVLVAKWSIGLLKQTTGPLLDHQASTEELESIRNLIESDKQTWVTDLHVWSIGPNIYSVMVSVVTDLDTSPEIYKKRLDQHRFPHITVEINPPQRDSTEV